MEISLQSTGRRVNNIYIMVIMLLFQIVDKLLGRNKTFNEFFVNKISDIQYLLSTWVSTTDDMAYPPLETLLASSKSKLKYFKPAKVSQIRTIIQKSIIL